jgi:hypothetical protein
MGVRLHYAKVVDREHFLTHGGKIHPGLDNKVVLEAEPGKAAVFLVMRGWGDDNGTFTEQWRIEGSGGGLVHASVPREIHIATDSHVERLSDEVADLEFEYAADDYSLVFVLDELEAARVSFPVELPGAPQL